MSSTIDNQRNSHRLPVDPGERSAGIAIGRKVVKAEVLDQSRCGCRLQVEAKYGLKKDQVVRVATAQGQYQARVARVVGDERNVAFVQVGMEYVDEFKAKVKKSNFAYGGDQRATVGGEFNIVFSAVFVMAVVTAGLLIYLFRDSIFNAFG